MFLGLGYCSKALLDANVTDSVLSFEKYDEVVDLVSRNSIFSVNLKNPKFTLHQDRIDIEKQTTKFFKALKGWNFREVSNSIENGTLFDSVIIDPPKTGVMMKVYSKDFLHELSTHIQPGGIIAAYVPNSVQDFQPLRKTLETVETTFESNQFKLINKTHGKTIHTYQKV